MSKKPFITNMTPEDVAAYMLTNIEYYRHNWKLKPHDKELLRELEEAIRILYEPA
jgi:hypothetical protein